MKQVLTPRMAQWFGRSICALVTLGVSCAWAGPIPFSTTESGQYLIVGSQVGGKATDANTSNFELGAIKAPVPSTDKFLNDKPSDGLPANEFSGSTGGPSLYSSQPALPANAKLIGQGIGYGGNIAVIDPEADLGLSNVGVYGDLNVGIRLAGDVDNNKASNSFFNDPNHFPNTFNEATQSGIKVEANGTPGPDKLVADQTTRIDAPNSAGVTYNYDHTPLVNELAAAKTAINGLTATGVLNTSADGGKLNNTSTLTGNGISFSSPNTLGGFDVTITLQSGLNVFDIVTHPTGDAKDFLLNNANLVIDGPSDAFVIFRLTDNNNMLVENSNILIGNGGIGHHNVLFYTGQDDNDVNFKFNNMIVNGVAFWALGTGTIHVNNGQGCTQFIADQVNLQDVRFDRCAFGTENHVPDTAGTLGLAALAFLGLGAFRRLLGTPAVR